MTAREWRNARIHLTHRVMGRKSIRPHDLRPDGLGNWFVYLTPTRRLHVLNDKIIAFEHVNASEVERRPWWKRLSPRLEAAAIGVGSLLLFLLFWAALGKMLQRACGA